MRRFRLLALGIVTTVSPALVAQSALYSGVNVTGQLVLSGTENLRQLAESPQAQARPSLIPEALASGLANEHLPHLLAKRLHPPIQASAFASTLTSPATVTPPLSVTSSASFGFNGHARVGKFGGRLLSVTSSASFGFNGLSHLDQRNANGGNQFSTEPPTPSVAVGNGFVMEGVDNAVQVYSLSGTPYLPLVVSTNQLFGIPAAINRTSNVFGVFPTDMRVFYDADISRWFVLQWAQLNDAFDNPINQSHEWIAVSQSSDPTGTYNIYSMDTTADTATSPTFNPGCPCVPDYPQVGADKWGFYIASNQFSISIFGNFFLNASILAISKASLANGVSAPTAVQFQIQPTVGYEFAIQPASTPPGASYFLADNGLEYFVSSVAQSSFGNALAVWAMPNTSSLAGQKPNLSLMEAIIPTQTYSFPNVATQRPGPLPYGSSLSPPGTLEFLDGGDTRILSLAYAGGRLYTTLQTLVIDPNSGHQLVGGAYFILSPTFRAGVLNAVVLRQGYLVTPNNHLLRPAIAVNPQGMGAIVCTLVGPDYFPSAVFVPISASSTASALQVSGAGAFPEDGFTGYEPPGAPVARWGDDSVAVVDEDGSIWMVTEYIPNAPRTQFANWGTFVTRYIP